MSIIRSLLEPCQTLKMEVFVKIVNILNIRLGCEHASAYLSATMSLLTYDIFASSVESLSVNSTFH